MSAFNQPNSPKIHPWLQTFQCIVRSKKHMEECNKRYGDIFSLHMGQFAPQVVISNQQVIEQIFITVPKHLH